MLDMHQKAYIVQSMYWWSKRSPVQTNIRIECSFSPLTGLSGLVAWVKGQFLVQPVLVPERCVESIVIKSCEKLLHLFVFMLLRWSLSYTVAWPVWQCASLVQDLIHGFHLLAWSATFLIARLADGAEQQMDMAHLTWYCGTYQWVSCPAYLDSL